MINFYDIIRSKLTSKDVEPGSLYFCRDTGEVYLDSLYTNERYVFGGLKVTVDPGGDNNNRPYTHDGYISEPGIHICGSACSEGTNVFYVDPDKNVYNIFRGITYNNCILFENEISIAANTTKVFMPGHTIDGFNINISSSISKVEFIPDASFEDLVEITTPSVNNCTVKTGNFTVYGRIRVWGNSIIHIDTSLNHQGV